MTDNASSAANRPGLCLWAGCARPHGLDTRLAVATAAGFPSMSIAPGDLRQWSEQGTTPAEVRERAAAAGVRIAVIDPLTKWTPVWQPPAEMPAEYVAFCDFEPEEVFEMALAVGADTVSTLELLGNEQDPGELTAAFHALCRRAEPLGLRLALEAVPFTGIPDLATAWPIVEDAPANGGLVVDAWHLFRGPDPQRNLEILAAVPAPRVFAAQVNDAPAQAWDDLRAETMVARLLPGEGEQDLDRFLAALELADDAVIGPEVLSEKIWAMPADEAGRLLGDSIRRTLPGFAG